MAERDSAIAKCRAAKLSHKDTTIWAKRDQPIQVRVPQSVLSGAQKLFVQWGFNRKSSWVDEDTNTLTQGKNTDKVFEVVVEKGIWWWVVVEVKLEDRNSRNPETAY